MQASGVHCSPYFVIHGGGGRPLQSNALPLHNNDAASFWPMQQATSGALNPASHRENTLQKLVTTDSKASRCIMLQRLIRTRDVPSSSSLAVTQP